MLHGIRNHQCDSGGFPGAKNVGFYRSGCKTPLRASEVVYETDLMVNNAEMEKGCILIAFKVAKIMYDLYNLILLSWTKNKLGRIISMKIFVINLERDVNKKERIINECDRLNLDFEIFNAVDGGALSESFLKETVLDYGSNFLTNGEIGCSLSHLNLYEKIINDGLPYALILEDDAILNDKIVSFISTFEKNNKKEGFYLLTGDFDYIENKKIKLGEFDVFSVVSAIMTTGYIITRETAKKMIKFLYPVRFEADMFKIFRICTGVNIYATIPHLISNNDKAKGLSSLEMERSILVENRMEYRSNLFKKKEKRRKLAIFFWRVFVRKFLSIKEYKDY